MNYSEPYPIQIQINILPKNWMIRSQYEITYVTIKSKTRRKPILICYVFHQLSLESRNLTQVLKDETQ